MQDTAASLSKMAPKSVTSILSSTAALCILKTIYFYDKSVCSPWPRSCMNAHSPAGWPQYKERQSKYTRQRMKGARNTEVQGQQQNQGQSHLSWVMHKCPYQHSIPLPCESKAPLDCMCPIEGIYLFVSIVHSSTICISLTSSYPWLQNKHNSRSTKNLLLPNPLHFFPQGQWPLVSATTAKSSSFRRTCIYFVSIPAILL